jgi:hypothetical protein
MPVDCSGRELKVGDFVTVLCRINNAVPDERYANLDLVTVEPYYPQDDPKKLQLNSRQVELVVEPTAPAADATAPAQPDTPPEESVPNSESASSSEAVSQSTEPADSPAPAEEGSN